jgi:hypothetical protein
MYPRPSRPPPVDRPAPSMRDREPKTLSVETLLETHDAPSLEIALEERAHDLGMLLDHMERPVLDPIAERNNAAHPHSLLL